MDVHNQKLAMGREALFTQVPLGGNFSWEAQSTGGVQISMEEKEEMKDPKASTMLY